MRPETIFVLANLLAAAGWLALAVRPRHARVLQWAGQIVPLLLAVLYAGTIAMRFGRVEGDFSSLAGVAALFRDPWVLLAGWVHYLAFDLLIGVWQVRDAARRRIPHALVLPCLLATFFFGPIGWLLYQITRATRSRNDDSVPPID